MHDALAPGGLWGGVGVRDQRWAHKAGRKEGSGGRTGEGCVNVGDVAQLALREALAQVADVLVHAEGHEVPGERRRQRLQQANLQIGTHATVDPGRLYGAKRAPNCVGRWPEGQAAHLVGLVVQNLRLKSLAGAGKLSADDRVPYGCAMRSQMRWADG